MASQRIGSAKFRLRYLRNSLIVKGVGRRGFEPLKAEPADLQVQIYTFSTFSNSAKLTSKKRSLLTIYVDSRRKVRHSFRANLNRKSESKVSRQLPTLSKTDIRYWQSKVYLRDYQRGGKNVVETNYSAQIQFKKRRYRFVLDTPNKTAAAGRARDIYKSLLELGWDETLKTYGRAEDVEEEVIEQTSSTIGELIGVIEEIGTARPASLATYFKAIRKIAADIHRIKKGRKYDAKRGGHQAWKDKVDKIQLHTLSPDAVLEWKVRFLKSVEPAQLRSAKTTVNSLIRNAKSLFAKKHMRYLRNRLELPDTLPFEDLQYERQPSMRYHSKINATKILTAAKEELFEQEPEAYKIILLALMCGLRKSEMDTLMWDAFNFEDSKLLIEPNEYNLLKSEDSAGEIELDGQLNTVFWQFWQKAEGRFVIESPFEARHRTVARSYRAEHHFVTANRWLRKQGSEARKPLHELRKEFGSLINERYGIYAASRALRHSQIAITVAHYTDKKERFTVGLGDLLV